MERVRYFIDLTALKLQVHLIYGTTSVPRMLKDILIFLCPFLFPAYGLGDRSNSIKPVTCTPPQPHSLIPPDFFLYREERRLFVRREYLHEVYEDRRVPILILGSSNDDTRLYESNCRCFKFSFQLSLSKMPNLVRDLCLKLWILRRLFHRPVCAKHLPRS